MWEEAGSVCRMHDGEGLQGHTGESRCYLLGDRKPL